VAKLLEPDLSRPVPPLRAPLPDPDGMHWVRRGGGPGEYCRSRRELGEFGTSGTRLTMRQAEKLKLVRWCLVRRGFVRSQIDRESEQRRIDSGPVTRLRSRTR